MVDLDSNAEFDAMADPQLYIDQQEADWTSFDDDELSTFMLDILSNNLSSDLANRLD